MHPAWDWISEHLSAFRVELGGVSAHAGVGLPVPLDEASSAQLSPKVQTLRDVLRTPVLIENSAVYIEMPEQSWTEAGFLNRLGDASGCGILLDLHNLFVNEINLGWDI